MHKLLTDKKRQCCVVVLIALLLSLIVEIGVFMMSSCAIYSEHSTSLLAPSTVQKSTTGYEIHENWYTQKSKDPQLVFTNINDSFDYVLISFGAPIYKQTALQAFYSAPGEAFSASYSTEKIYIPFAASHVVVEIPEGYYGGLRLDVDGNFALNDVVVSADPIVIRNQFTDSFHVLRTLILFVVFVGIGAVLLYWLRKPKSILKLSAFELLLCVACFVFYTLWAIAKPITYAPDEQMRFEVTQFLFEHNRLPVGDELISQPWGFSYAHFPIVLCNQLGYLFMKVASLVTSDSFKLLVAARMVSVCAGTGVVYCVIKSSKLLFRSPARFIMIAFVAFMPQFAFLSSYVNNDSLALLGVAMIVYAWVLATEFQWNWKSALLLAVGVAICGLAYYNSYSWILLSIVFFVVSYYYQNPRDYKGFSKMLLFIVAVVVLLIGYNFIRHVVLYGDLLGFKTRRYYGELYGDYALKPSVTQSLMERGVPFTDMLFESPYYFIKYTWQSFVGVFSYLSVFCPNSVYDGVLACVWVAVAGLVLKVILDIVRKKRWQPMKIFMVVCMIISAMISIGLSVQMSYTGDFQPQGRYCYPAFITVAFLVAKGFETFISMFKRREHQYVITAILCTAFASMSYYAYTTVFLPS